MKKWLCLLLCAALLLPAAALGEPKQLSSLSEKPAVNGDGFLNAGEQAAYYKNHAEGVWFYVDEDVRIEITRSQTKKPLLTWYIAEIHCRRGTTMYTVPWNEKRPGRTNGLPQDLAQRARAVFAMSGDFYSYRISHDRYPGVIIRDGKVLYKKTYTKKAIVAVPNLDTFAFYPSGKAEVNVAFEKNAKYFTENGAETVLAFGPMLLRENEPADLDKPEYNHEEPRVCIGYVGPGHFVALLVEGRNNHSSGATLAECQEILQDIGCSDALNLDGGNTAAMLFMGESVMLNDAGGPDENTRAIPDILCAGRY